MPRSAALAAALLAISAAGAAAKSAPVRLLGSPADEQSPAAGGRYLSWTQNSPRQRKHFDVYARRGSGRPWRVNPPGTQARMGGIDETTLVYEEIARGQSDLRLYDLSRRRRLGTPAGVNTPKPETGPSLSRPWLLFVRVNHADGVYRVLLRNLRTGKQIQLEALGGHNPFASAGQLRSRFAVWASCPGGACDVYRYDLRTHRTIKVPNKDSFGHPQYAPSVIPDGTVYFGRSGESCGDAAKLMRYARGSTSTVLAFPAGQDFAASYAVDSGEQVTVFYDRASCRTNRFDVFSLVVEERVAARPG
ncbi:MAG: hypothetical protein M3R39_02245 [Actinomycetota bacterium]|nr:hypothetical protein [Actinomycetota bacterium]